MAVFTYKAVGADGKTKAGNLPAASRAAAISELSATGLIASGNQRAGGADGRGTGCARALGRGAGYAKRTSRALRVSCRPCWRAGCHYRGRCICCAARRHRPARGSSGKRFTTKSLVVPRWRMRWRRIRRPSPASMWRWCARERREGSWMWCWRRSPTSVRGSETSRARLKLQ